MSQGTALLMSYQLPQTWSHVDNAWEMTVVQDYVSVAWPVIDATFRYSIFLLGSLVAHAPMYSGILQGLSGQRRYPLLLIKKLRAAICALVFVGTLAPPGACSAYLSSGTAANFTEKTGDVWQISVAYQTTVTFTTNRCTVGTVPSSGNFSTYARDLVVTNSGTATCYVGVGPAVTQAVTTSSFAIPSGGSVILTQCQVPASTVVAGVQAVATTTSQVSIGFATNVAFF